MRDGGSALTCCSQLLPLLHIYWHAYIYVNKHIYQQIYITRSLGALRAPTSSLRPFGPPWLRPSRPSGAQAVWPTEKILKKSKTLTNQKISLINPKNVVAKSKKEPPLSNLFYFKNCANKNVRVQIFGVNACLPYPKKWIQGTFLFFEHIFADRAVFAKKVALPWAFTK